MSRVSSASGGRKTVSASTQDTQHVDSHFCLLNKVNLFHSKIKLNLKSAIYKNHHHHVLINNLVITVFLFDVNH